MGVDYYAYVMYGAIKEKPEDRRKVCCKHNSRANFCPECGKKIEAMKFDPEEIYDGLDVIWYNDDKFVVGKIMNSLSEYDEPERVKATPPEEMEKIEKIAAEPCFYVTFLRVSY